MLPRIERRRNRSRNVTEALSYQLQQSMERSGTESLVLADGDGLVLAASNEDPAIDEVAALARFLGRSGSHQGPLASSSGPRHVSIHRFRHGPTSLYLCALGGPEEVHGVEVHRAIRGIERILAA